MSRLQIHTSRQTEIDWNELQGDIRRLMDHEPVQYVTGIAWYCDMTFHVTSDVLIPRPETEELIQKVKESAEIPKRILDIGTGSGCIAIVLKKIFPEADVSASDISESALHIATRNAEKYNAPIRFIHDDILNSNISSKYDLIVSNPPYVTEKEKAMMEDHVLNHEPHSALFVPDNDPLKFYRSIAGFASEHLYPAGHLLFEINEAYKNEVCELLSRYHFANIESFTDIHNKWRIIKVTKP